MIRPSGGYNHFMHVKTVCHVIKSSKPLEALCRICWNINIEMVVYAFIYKIAKLSSTFGPTFPRPLNTFHVLKLGKLFGYRTGSIIMKRQHQTIINCNAMHRYLSIDSLLQELL